MTIDEAIAELSANCRGNVQAIKMAIDALIEKRDRAE